MNEADVTVVGMGYAGLSIAVAGCKSGMRVHGYDIDHVKIAALRSGRSYVTDVSDADLRFMLDAGCTFSDSADSLGSSSVYLLSVPTPLRRNGVPDLSHITDVSRTLAGYLSAGDLVILESTSHPGTTDSVVQPLLERSGLKVGVDFSLGYSPERMDPGDPDRSVREMTRLVSGVTEKCALAVQVFMSRICNNVIQMGIDVRETELAKLIENSFRQVNIAFVNEILKLGPLLNANVWKALKGAATKPYGFHSFLPGPGVGGHCVPIDAIYLAHAAEAVGGRLDLIRTADSINLSMPEYVASSVGKILGGGSLDGRRVALLGVTYKANVGDDRGSPARRVAAALARRGAEVLFHDPFFKQFDLLGDSILHEGLNSGDMPAIDLAVLLQAHTEYLSGALWRECGRVLDTRGVLVGPNVIRL